MPAEDKDFGEFIKQRLPLRLKELEKLGVNFRIPEAKVEMLEENNRKKIIMEAFVEDAKIYYTVDGQRADRTSQLYKGAFNYIQGRTIQNLITLL